MKRKLTNMILAGSLAVMMSMPCGALTVSAAEVPADAQGIAITNTTQAKHIDWAKLAKKYKDKIAQFLGIDIGDIRDIIVTTNDNVKVILKDNNININIDLIKIIINQK